MLTFSLALTDYHNIIQGDVSWAWYLLAVVVDLLYVMRSVA